MRRRSGRPTCNRSGSSVSRTTTSWTSCSQRRRAASSRRRSTRSACCRTRAIATSPPRCAMLSSSVGRSPTRSPCGSALAASFGLGGRVRFCCGGLGVGIDRVSMLAQLFGLALLRPRLLGLLLGLHLLPPRLGRALLGLQLRLVGLAGRGVRRLAVLARLDALLLDLLRARP